MKTHKQKVISAYQSWEAKRTMREALSISAISILFFVTVIIVLCNTHLLDVIDNVHPIIPACVAMVSFGLFGYYLIWGRK